LSEEHTAARDQRARVGVALAGGLMNGAISLTSIDVQDYSLAACAFNT